MIVSPASFSIAMNDRSRVNHKQFDHQQMGSARGQNKATLESSFFSKAKASGSMGVWDSMDNAPYEAPIRQMANQFYTRYPTQHTPPTPTLRYDEFHDRCDRDRMSGDSTSPPRWHAQEPQYSFSSTAMSPSQRHFVENPHPDFSPHQRRIYGYDSVNEDSRFQYSHENYTHGGSAPTDQNVIPYRAYGQRRPSNRDEFDGPAQYLDRPIDADIEPSEDDLPQLPVHLHAHEQDHILSTVNKRLSQCAFDFVARYSFPIPLESDKRPVSVPGDREWSEWVHLLKRLATKRRIPARVLYNGQIRQFVTILENSLEMRHAAMHQSRPLKDDRNVLQLISSGIQVGRILKDADCVRCLDAIYVHTERLIQSRATAQAPSPSTGDYQTNHTDISAP